LATYDVTLDENGSLKSSRKLVKGDLGKNVWYAYLSTNGPDPWYNGQTYVDTLNEDAMAYFIKITHEVYKSKVGDKFGSVVPCIFTDEPQFERKTQLSNPWASTDVALPWTADLAQTFRKQYSSDLIEALPELVWNLPEGKPSVARWRYHDHGECLMARNLSNADLLTAILHSVRKICHRAHGSDWEMVSRQQHHSRRAYDGGAYPAQSNDGPW
jgi:hypothetical protein